MENPLTDFARTNEFFNGWVPAVDVLEDKDSIIVRAELPGIKKEDIDLSLHEGVLSLSGERKEKGRSEDSETYRSERFYGRFHRTVTLPKPVAADKVQASYKDGLLTVTLPKTEEAKPRQIEVNLA
jgi:HSP20 family protein